MFNLIEQGLALQAQSTLNRRATKCEMCSCVVLVGNNGFCGYKCKNEFYGNDDKPDVNEHYDAQNDAGHCDSDFA